ncbi:nuclear transport factor 2 family protein [Nocardioides sp.]|uniref:nuclear transport factor 2 family protein n=1 Tax=Nocardioides sp. TaxID=35761 RepID=UPI00272338D3|nr:nuclear transport factor 2 family protein [Nocardioides sp.]MDO9456198.1 nuclear transport factor 2 family protein [Nocardioides sp.]
MDSARAIEHLLYTYAERVDAGDFAGVGALFEHGAFFGVAGADAVAALFEQTTRRHPVAGTDGPDGPHGPGTPLTQHVVTNAVVEVDEPAGTASCRSRFQVLQATEILPLQVIVAGRYRDTFHRLDGAWWFRSRQAHLDLVGDVSQHLLPGALP